MKKLLVALVMFQAIIFAEGPKYINNADIFVSFPRTGTNWTLAGLQVLTRRYISFPESYPGLAGVSNEFYMNRFSLKLDKRKPPIYRTHNVIGDRIRKGAGNRVFMILRNYREVFLRHCKLNNKGSINVKFLHDSSLGKSIARKMTKYVKMLEACDSLPNRSRLIFRYEDLITNPRQTFQTLLDFLGESDKRLDEFITNIDTYKKRCVASYHNQHKGVGGSISKGQSSTYHSDHTEEETIRLIDNMMREKASDYIWEKYLSQYCTPL